MKPSEIVEGAMEILEEKGWCVGANVDLNGRVCVGEALMEVATLGKYSGGDYYWYWRLDRLGISAVPVNNAASAILCEAFGAVPNDPSPFRERPDNDWSTKLNALYRVVSWNDDTASLTIDEVKDTMMAAAKTLRDRGE